MKPLPDTVELTLNLLINSIAKTLKSNFGHRVYARELRQGFKDPCFFIELVSSRGSRIGFRRLSRLQALVIHFFPEGFEKLDVADEVIYLDQEPDDEAIDELDLDFESAALSMAERLYRVLELVEVSDKVFNGNKIHARGTNMSHTTSGGVLHFNVNYNYHLLEEQIDPYMEALIQNTLPKSMKDWDFEDLENDGG